MERGHTVDLFALELMDVPLFVKAYLLTIDLY
jgi:hypothetical protein